MQTADIIRLISLAAIWGGSFIFMRIASPILGPVITADLRVLIGALVLIAYFAIAKVPFPLRQHWKLLLLFGGIGTALPFLCFSFAALHIPAGYSAVLNGTTPFFGAFFAMLWGGEKLTVRKVCGLLLGMAGVALVVELVKFDFTINSILALAAGSLAAACYGLTNVLIRKYGSHIPSMTMAAGVLLFASLWLAPLVPFNPVRADITLAAAGSLLALGAICSGLAFLLYFKLLANVGVTKALTVTQLVTVFGLLWGLLFFREPINMFNVLGAALIIVGTTLVVRPPKTKQLEAKVAAG